MIRRSATDDLSSVVCWELLAPHVAIAVRHVCHSHAIRHLSTEQRSGDNRNVRTAGPVLSYPQPTGLRLSYHSAHDVALNDVASGHDRRGVQIHSTVHEHDQCICGDVRGSEVSLGGLR